MEVLRKLRYVSQFPVISMLAVSLTALSGCGGGGGGDGGGPHGKFPEGGHKQSSFGWVTACDEALLSYGNYQALTFDGETWTEIVNRPILSQN